MILEIESIGRRYGKVDLHPAAIPMLANRSLASEKIRAFRRAAGMGFCSYSAPRDCETERGIVGMVPASVAPTWNGETIS
jgi:hypothetical protein